VLVNARNGVQRDADLALLEKLVDEYDYVLSAADAQRFREMHETLRMSATALSPKQRAWVARELAAARTRAQHAPKPTTPKVFAFERMPRPLKPPTRLEGTGGRR
jgi:hypothetical protein